MRLKNHLENKYIGLVSKTSKKQKHVNEVSDLIKKLNRYLNINFKNTKYKFELLNEKSFRSPSDMIDKKNNRKLDRLIDKWMSANNDLENFKTFLKK